MAAHNPSEQRRLRGRSIALPEGSETRAFKVVFAFKNPYLACVAPMQEEAFHTPLLAGAIEELVRAGGDWAWRFSVDFMSVSNQQDMVFGSEWKLSVLLGLTFQSGSLVVSEGDLVPWAEWASQYAAEGGGSGEEDGPEKGHGARELPVASRYPWLAAVLGEEREEVARGPVRKGRHWLGDEPDAPKRQETSDLDDDQDELDTDVAEVFELLHAKRAEWELDCPRLGGDFRRSLLGGVRCSARFDVALYGERGASILSQAWVHRMQHLYDCSVLAAQDPGVSFSALMEEVYHEPEDFSDLAKGLHGRALERALAIRSLLPREEGEAASGSGGP